MKLFVATVAYVSIILSGPQGLRQKCWSKCKTTRRQRSWSRAAAADCARGSSRSRASAAWARLAQAQQGELGSWRNRVRPATVAFWARNIELEPSRSLAGALEPGALEPSRRARPGLPGPSLRLSASQIRRAAARTAAQLGTAARAPARLRACSSPRVVQRPCLGACCAQREPPAALVGDRHRSTETDFQQAILAFGRQKPSGRHIAREPLEAELCLSSLSSPLLANKPSGRHIREPLEVALWPSRALLAASARRFSSWRT
jgi:hypothetical protein